MGVFLRYLGDDIALAKGEYFLGRDPDCHICLADPIISRRHAVLRVDAEGATIEDLGSRNGVIVNRVRIEGRCRLADGDALVLGGQALVFHTGGLERPARKSMPPPRPADPRAFSAVTTVGQSVSTAADLPDAFEKIVRVANHALATGRAEEAERTLERALAEVLSLSRAKIDVGGKLVASAARQAAYLAAATRKGTWIDYVFDLYTVRREPIPIPISDLLSGPAEGVAPEDRSTVTTYLAVSRALGRDNAAAARSNACVESLAKRYGLGS
jgi:hypothetical protein